MIDVEPLIESSFARMLPASTVTPDWSDVLTRSRSRQRRRGLRSPRVVLAFVAFALVATAGALAAAGQLPWWQSGSPPANPWVVHMQLAPGSVQYPAQVDRERARTVAESDGATLVAAPMRHGDGYCMIPALPGSPDIGFSCEYQTSDEVRAYARPGKAPRWIIWGRLTRSDAASIDLSNAVGAPLNAKLEVGGFFIANLPPSRWSAINGAAGMADILDASGRTLESVCIQFGPAPSASNAGQFATGSSLETSGKCEPAISIPMAPVLDQAKLLVSTVLVQDFALFKAGERVGVYEAPDAGSPATCTFVETVPAKPLAGHPRGVEGCGLAFGKQTTPDHPVQVSYSYAASSGAFALVVGQVDPSLNASRVVVRFVDGSEAPLALESDHFIGEVRSSDAAPTATAEIVAFAADGHEVARQKLSH